MRMLGMVGGALARAGREIRAVARAETTTHRHLRDRLVAITAGSRVGDPLFGGPKFLFRRPPPRPRRPRIRPPPFFRSPPPPPLSPPNAEPPPTPRPGPHA